MNKRTLTTAALLALMTANIQAQMLRQSPRLIVNITIDQLTSEYMEACSSYFGTDGFKMLMREGLVYQNVEYPFSPIDKASAMACIMTGTTPYYNGIMANRWMDRSTLRLTGCTEDPQWSGIYTTDKASPRNLLSSTITDELKVSSQGKAIIWSISKDRDAAILSAGHAADGAIWKDSYNGGWCSSAYYLKTVPSWLTEFNTTEGTKKKNTEFQELTELTNLAALCVERSGMGTDDIPDMLNLTLDASIHNPQGRTNRGKRSRNEEKEAATWQERLTQTYINLDRQLADLIATIRSKVGTQNVLFFITGTGHCEEPVADFDRYKIPSGTFYINRTANLLNMYLGAIYGSDNYIVGCSRNQIYLNIELIEKKRLKLNEILSLSQSFLLQCEGVRNAHTSESLLFASNPSTALLRNGFNSGVGGNLIIEVAPGWKLQNETSGESYHITARTPLFPLIILGSQVKAQHISQPVTMDRLAPTIASTIHIRAPNACSSKPLDIIGE